MVHTAQVRRTKTLLLVVTKGLFCRRLRSERWIRMRAGLGEAHAEELRRPVLVFRVSSLPLRSTAWDPSSGFTYTLQVTGPAACFPQEFPLVMSSDRRGRVRLGPGLSPPPFPVLAREVSGHRRHRPLVISCVFSPAGVWSCEPETWLDGRRNPVKERGPNRFLQAP